MAHDVFLSYSAKDKPVADAVCHALEAAGIRAWMAPRDITPGATWAGAIMQAIASSRVMIVIFSSASNMSDQVLREVERAVGKGVTIIPFRIEDVRPSDAMEYFLGTPHWLDAFTPPLEQHIHRLVDGARRNLGLPGPRVVVGAPGDSAQTVGATPADGAPAAPPPSAAARASRQPVPMTWKTMRGVLLGIFLAYLTIFLIVRLAAK